jgi:hypothetical protein
MPVHRGDDAVADPRLNASEQGGEPLAHQRRLLTLELPEHEVAQHFAGDGLGAPDADAQAGVLVRAERRLNAAQAIVSAGGALGAEPKRANGERNVIDDDEEVVGRRPERAVRVRLERVAAEVHERLRLEQAHSAPIQITVGGTRMRRVSPRGETPNVG